MSRRKEKYQRLADCSCDRIRRSARQVTQLYETMLREVGIKPSQFTILATLANSGTIALSPLADQLMLDRTGLTRNLAVLERNGWVRIQPGPHDQRQRVVALSNLGFDKLDQAIPHWRRAQQALSKKAGETTLVDLRENLLKISKQLS